MHARERLRLLKHDLLLVSTCSSLFVFLLSHSELSCASFLEAVPSDLILHVCLFQWCNCSIDKTLSLQYYHKSDCGCAVIYVYMSISQDCTFELHCACQHSSWIEPWAKGNYSFPETCYEFDLCMNWCFILILLGGRRRLYYLGRQYCKFSIYNCK